MVLLMVLSFAGSSVITLFVMMLFIQGVTLNRAYGLSHNILAMNFDQSKKLSLVKSSSVTGINGDVSNNNETVLEMTGMSSMMQTPQDVIIKVESNPIIPVGTESQIKLLILDKTTQKPINGAQVIIGVERGAAMTTMYMMGPMFQAQEQGKDAGVYLVSFTPDFKGIYTLHTHVILPGKPMYSMMDNHLDIGIVAQ